MRTKISIAIAVVAGILTASCSMSDPLPRPDSPMLNTLVYWFRLLPGFIGMLFALAGGYMMYRVTRYNKTLEASENTVKIYREQLEAMTGRMKQMQEDHAVAVQQLLLLQTEAKELRGRTDLTEVLKVQQQLLVMKKDHDAEISGTLKDAIDRGQKQYAEVMDTLNKTLNYLADQARNGSKTSDQNHELLIAVSSAVSRIADKLTGVESAVNKNQDQLSDVKDAVDAITDHIDPPTPEPEPDPKRRCRDARR